MERNVEFNKRDTFFYDLFLGNKIGQVIVDEQFNIMFANNRMFELLDFAPYDVVNMSFGQAFHCGELGANCQECGVGDSDCCKNCGVMNVVRTIRRGSLIDNSAVKFSYYYDNHFEEKWFQLNGGILSYHDQDCIALVLADITDLKQREKHLKELLSLDLATGSMNKYSLMKAIKKRVRTKETADQYSICMIDFDNFKSLNDQHGHLFGDRVLEKFSDIARRHIRKDDIFGRYGGEEFIFVFNNIDERQSLEILKRIHTELEKYFAKRYKITVTFSAGVFTIDHGTMPLSHTELLVKVDSLLYEAKSRGRGRAMSSSGEIPFNV